MNIIFATGNNNKVKEAQKAIGDNFTLIMPKSLGLTEDIPENGETLEENAIEKAQYLWDKYNQSCFADDTGLEVEALNGAPGVHTARYAGEDKDNLANIHKLLLELKKVEQESGIINRKARFVTIIALIINGKITTFKGVLEGTIAYSMVGEEGFGYDPIFIPNGYNKTLAEISLEEKTAISHRGKAIRLLAEHLKWLENTK